MPKIKADLRDVKDLSQAAPAAIYPVEVKKIEQKIGKESGNPYLNLQLEVLDGEWEGKTFFSVLTMPPDKKKWFSLKQFATALGYDLDAENLDIDTDEWIGAKLSIRVNKVYNEEQKKDQNEIKQYLPLGE